MIKFEHNMLVLNSAFSEEDVDEINAFADYVRSQECKRIIKLIEKLHDSEYGEITTVEELVFLIKDQSQ